MQDKTNPGLVFKSSRYTDAEQRKRLLAAGAKHIVPIRNSWRDMFKGARVIRDGDTVYIFALVLVPTERGGDTLPPSAQPTAFLYECKAVGATVVEVWTGRKSSSRKDFDAMIADAVAALRGSTGRIAPRGFGQRGRPKTKVPMQGTREFNVLRAIWKSHEYENAEQALAAMAAEGFDGAESTARRLFGKRFR